MSALLRKVLLILPFLIAGLGVANLAVLAGRWQAARPAAQPRTAWERWYALPLEQRLELVRQYEAVARRPDARTIWHALHEFSQLDPAHQQRLRALFQIQQDVIAEQNPARRADLLRAEPGERAFFVYEALKRSDPARLDRLAQQAEAPADATP